MKVLRMKTFVEFIIYEIYRSFTFHSNYKNYWNSLRDLYMKYKIVQDNIYIEQLYSCYFQLID